MGGLRRAGRMRATAACIGVMLALAACTVTAPPAPVTEATRSGQPSARPFGPVTLPPRLTAYEPIEGETQIGSLSSQTGINEVGPFDVSSDRIAIYVDCVGIGEVIIDISGVGTFDNPCHRDAEALGTRNEFDMRYVDEYSVRVTGSDDQLWALTVVEPEE